MKRLDGEVKEVGGFEGDAGPAIVGIMGSGRVPFERDDDVTIVRTADLERLLAYVRHEEHCIRIRSLNLPCACGLTELLEGE
jgi:hypothetical protein